MCLPKFKSFKIELLIQIASINQYIDYLYLVMRYRYAKYRLFITFHHGQESLQNSKKTKMETLRADSYYLL